MVKNYFNFSKFTLFVALAISAIAAWYSVIGLTAIFAGAVIPIIVMGSTLEIAKITTTVWLHRYWSRATAGIKIYLSVAVVVLACLTSMGIFGFLSKAHSDQSLVSGDAQAKVAIYDEKIKVAKENIEADRKQLKQMDEAVDQVMARSTSEDGASKSNAIRKAQARDRMTLAKSIETNQKLIASLNDEAAPIRAEIRKVEAEVGPIKYIAALIYGDNPDSTLLERSVRWVIILIVSVFDPLAIVLILAANNSIQWAKEDEQLKKHESSKEERENDNDDASIEIPQKSTDHADEYKEKSKFPELNLELLNTTNEEQHTNEESVFKKHYDVSYTMSPYSIKLPEKNETGVATTEEHELSPSEDVKSGDDNITDEEEKVDVSDKSEESLSVGYMNYQGKQYSVAALKEIRPDLVKSASKNDIMFGTQFPEVAKIGDVYTKVDTIPHETYKFNGGRWIKIDRKTNISYLQNIAYLQFLISKLESGEYDPDLLSDTEKEEISEYLRSTS